MLTTRQDRWTVFFSVICMFGSALFFWPLSFLGIIAVALTDFWPLAILYGLILDVLYGAPPASFHFLQFPFTLFAIVLLALRIPASRYLRSQGRGDVI